MMKKLNVSVEKNGALIPVGTITGKDCSDARFRHLDEYRVEAGTPVSIALPLQEDAFSAEQTARFFEGLSISPSFYRVRSRWISKT